MNIVVDKSTKCRGSTPEQEEILGRNRNKIGNKNGNRELDENRKKKKEICMAIRGNILLF